MSSSLAFDFVAYLSILVGADLGWGEPYQDALTRVAAHNWVHTSQLSAGFLHRVLIANPLQLPPMSDLTRFKVTLDEGWRKSTHCMQATLYLQQNRGIFPWPKYETDRLLEDLEWRWNCWAYLAQAIMHSETGCVYDARQWLDGLRNLLGEEMYELGQMPAHLPPGVTLPPHVEYDASSGRPGQVK